MKKKVSEKLIEELHLKSAELMEKEDYEKARKIYAKLIDLDPGDTTNYYNHALTYFHRQEFTQAYVLFEKLSGIDMDDELKKNVDELRVISKSGLLGRKAFDLKEAHEPELAVPILLRALEICPKNDEALYFLGMVYQSLEKIEEAIKCYESLFEVDESNDFQCPLRMRLGECYLSLNNIENAEKQFAYVLLNDDTDIYLLVHFKFADIEFRKQNFSKSLTHLKTFKSAIDRCNKLSESDEQDLDKMQSKYIRARISIYRAMNEKEKAIKLAKRYFNKLLKHEILMEFQCVSEAFNTLEINNEWEYLRFLDKKDLFHNFGTIGLAPLDLYLKAIIAFKYNDNQLALDYFLQIKEYVREFALMPDYPEFDELWEMLSTKKDDYCDFNISDSGQAFGQFVDEKIEELEDNS